jgi:hypothetical protein
MAPQADQVLANSSSSSEYFRPGVQQAVEYGNGMEAAARKFQLIIFTLWISSTILILTQRILLQSNPYTITWLDQEIFEIPKLNIFSERTVERLDSILFSLNYTLISFLMVLQFLPYGEVSY